MIDLTFYLSFEDKNVAIVIYNQSLATFGRQNKHLSLSNIEITLLVCSLNKTLVIIITGTKKQLLNRAIKQKN